jgi:hypothetical protein
MTTSSQVGTMSESLFPLNFSSICFNSFLSITYQAFCPACFFFYHNGPGHLP